MQEWASPVAGEEQDRLLAIEKGIPPYLRPRVVAWAMDRVRPQKGSGVDEILVSDMELVFKQEHPRFFSLFENFFSRMADDRLVTVLDWFLFYDINGAVAEAGSLRRALNLGRSEWTVSDVSADPPRMTRRVPAGSELMIRDIVKKTGSAGTLLVEAFNAVYGVTPNSDSAYGLSVKAVETLACPKYLPSNTRATLGSVIAHLSQKDVTLPLLEGNVPDKDLIVSMMRKLWAGGERHGSETYQHVSAEGAKVALALAFSLVSLLHEDVITVS